MVEGKWGRGNGGGQMGEGEWWRANGGGGWKSVSGGEGSEGLERFGAESLVDYVMLKDSDALWRAVETCKRWRWWVRMEVNA